MDCFDNQGLMNQLLAEAGWEHIPAAIFGELTRRCNLRCHHCFLSSYESDYELTTAEWFRVLDEVAELGGFLFTISGGEPLLRYDLEEIAAHAVELGYFTRLFTNGTLIDEERVKRLAQVKWQAIEVSLHGASAHSHDALTGTSGSFAQTMKALHLIKEAGITLNIKSNITRFNFHEIDALNELADSLEATKRFSPVITASEDGSTPQVTYRLLNEELETVLEFLKTIDNVEPSEPRTHIKGEPTSVAITLTCSAAHASFEVHANGEVTPCVCLPVVLGNVRLQSFGEIWYNNSRVERLLQLGEEIIPECLNCEYSYYCTRCPGSALVESGSLILPGTEECRFARASWKVEDRLWQKKNI
jgi:radical SAM protein with 4Fe4S-binding SPASM domain